MVLAIMRLRGISPCSRGSSFAGRLPRFAASFAINRLMYTSGRDVDDCGG